MARGAQLHVVLLAGGSGTRFWPLSRTRKPKQLQALVGKKTLLADTWKRVRRLAPASRIWVVAPSVLAVQVRRELPDLVRGHLIVEPTPRDTAPAVALACASVARKHPEAIVAIFPTDHVVGDVPAFVKSVKVAAREAEGGGLVCLGIEPTFPATGYGYLKCGSRPKGAAAVAVQRFVEKPNLEKAKRFLRSGTYLWNAGMFVWKARRFLEELARTAPGILRGVEGHLDGRRTAWSRSPRLSVDYAVMERARGVRVVPLDAGWDDVGSWDAAGRLRRAGGTPDRDNILVDSPGTVVFRDRRLVAVVGVPDIAVVDTPDALLVVSRRSSEQVRQVVDELKRRGRKDLL